MIGSSTPAVAASVFDHAPAASTTALAGISPSVVSTPVMREPSRRSRDTRTPARADAPDRTAAAMNPSAAGIGSA